MTRPEMEELVNIARHVPVSYTLRGEGMIIPQGMSLTDTSVSEYWRLREGNIIHMLKLSKPDLLFVYFQTVTKPLGEEEG